MSLTVKSATQYCLSKIKAATVQEALQGISFFNTLENTSYISKLLCANRFIELCRSLEINGVTGFYLVSDAHYKNYSKELRKAHKLETVFAANFPDYKFKTISEYYREFTNLVKQDERCINYDAKQWLSLCGGKSQPELRLPDSVHKDKAELTTALTERRKKPAAQKTDPPPEVTPPVPEQEQVEVADSSDDENDEPPTTNEPIETEDGDSDSDTDEVTVFQTPSEYDAIRKIADDLKSDPDQIHRFLCSLMSATGINGESIAKHHKKSSSETYNVYRQGATGHVRPKRR